MSNSILSRIRDVSFIAGSSLSPIQKQMDELSTRFLDEAVSPPMLVALMSGGVAYRLGRVGILAAGEKIALRSSLLTRFGSVVAGLGLEVGTFEGVNRSLSAWGGGEKNPNAWRWEGTGGWSQALILSGASFGMLRGAGFLARNQNIILQHALQSSAIVAGHQLAGAAHLVPRSEESLPQQLLLAEAMNLQVQGGMNLAQGLLPSYFAISQAMDLSMRFREYPTPPTLPTGMALASPLRVRSGEPPRDPRNSLVGSGMMMSPLDPPGKGNPSGPGNRDPGGGEKSSPGSPQEATDSPGHETSRPIDASGIEFRQDLLETPTSVMMASGTSLHDVQELRRQMLNTWADPVQNNIVQKDLELRFQGKFDPQTVESEIPTAIHRIHSLQSYLLVPSGRKVTLVFESPDGRENRIVLVRRRQGFERE